MCRAFPLQKILWRVYLAAAGLLAVVNAHPVQAATLSTCSANFTSPNFVKVAGRIADLMIDDQCQFIYATNSVLNQVEVYSLKTGKLMMPIPVGSAPMGLDTNANGTVLYVANSGGNDISVVDLIERTEIRRVKMDAETRVTNDTPTRIAVAKNGMVLFATNSTGNGRMMQLDPATNVISRRKDAPFDGGTSGATRLRTNVDRSAIYVGEGNTSAGTFYKYTAQSNTFSKPVSLNTYVGDVAVARTDEIIYAVSYLGGFMLNSDLKVVNTVPISADGGGFAVNSDGTLGYLVREGNDGSNGYQVENGTVSVIELPTNPRGRKLDVGDTITFYSAKLETSTTGAISASRDGNLLAVVTDHGFSVLRVAGQATDAAVSAAATLAVFSPAIPSLQSRLRFFNSGPNAGTVKVTLTDFATGKVAAQWTSPNIAPNSAPEFTVAEIAVGSQVADPSTYYLARVETSMTGTLTHTLFNTANSSLTNITACDQGANSPPAQLVNVKSSLSSGASTSYVNIVNTSAADAPVTLGVYDTKSGTKLGTYTATLSGGTGQILAINTLETAGKVLLRTAFPEYVIKIENQFTGYLQHLLRQPQNGLSADLTASCALPPS